MATPTDRDTKNAEGLALQLEGGIPRSERITTVARYTALVREIERERVLEEAARKFAESAAFCQRNGDLAAAQTWRGAASVARSFKAPEQPGEMGHACVCSHVKSDHVPYSGGVVLCRLCECRFMPAP